MKYNRENSTDYEHPQEYNLHNLHTAMEYDSQGRPILRTGDQLTGLTSKNRQKTSDSSLIFFSTHQFDKDLSVWDEAFQPGGTSVFDPLLSGVTMRVNGTQGAQVIRQTNRVIQYVPSRQNDTTMALRFDTPTQGIRHRAGLFDEKNGVFLEQMGEELYAVIRRNSIQGIVENRVEQDYWNVDKLDGNGPSGIVLDMTKKQMLNIEYEWYGAGAVQFRFVIDNKIIPVHIFTHANKLDRTWMSTPYLPLRLEITNVDGTSGIYSMHVASTSVVAEGNLDVLGKARNVQSSILGKETQNANVFIPLLSVRLREDRLNAVATLLSFQVAALTNDTGLFYQWNIDTSLSSPQWQAVPGIDSSLEYDINATAAVFGTQLKTGYVAPGSTLGKIPFEQDYSFQLPRKNIGSEAVVLTLSVATTLPERLTYGNVSWIETR